jgi:AcrR family transcriptional regulator
MVAAAAGVSVGLVQHHFANKAAHNALVLPLGTVILPGHIEPHLRDRFTAPAQLQRWREYVNT